MSMLTRARSIGRHRGKTPAQLRAELDEATCHLVAMATEIDELRAEQTRFVGRLDEAAINLGTAHEEIRQLEAVVRLRDQEIARLNHRIDVGIKAEHVIAKTQPIPIISRVRPLYEAIPGSTDPTQVPTSALRP